MTRGTFKTFTILTVFIVAIIFPIGETQTLKITIWTCIASFIIGIAIPNSFENGGLRNRVIIEKPKWTDSLNFKYPMTYVHIIGFLLIAAGTGGLIGGLINYQIINFVGTVLLATGLAILFSMYWTLMTKKQKKNSC